MDDCQIYENCLFFQLQKRLLLAYIFYRLICIFVWIFIQLCLYVCDVWLHSFVNWIPIIVTQTNYICLGCSSNFVNITVQ